MVRASIGASRGPGPGQQPEAAVRARPVHYQCYCHYPVLYTGTFTVTSLSYAEPAAAGASAGVSIT